MNGYMKEVVNDRQTTINHNFVTGHEYEFVVRAVGPDGTEEAIEHAVRDVINIVGEQFPPDVPTVLTATGFLLSITLAWVNPSNYDMDKMEIWRAVSNEVDAAVKIAEVRGTSYVDSIGESDITRYYWIKAVDTSGNISGFYPSTSTGVSATTVGVVATDIDDFSVTATKMFNKTIILNADAWTNNSPGAGSVAWNAHSVVYNGVSYPIDAGNTSSAYIYWTIGDTAYSAAATHPSLGTTAFMVAINTAGIHTLVWNSSANMVIGTAFIANLAVTNAKINDLSASKLTAGTIDASVITVTNLNADNINTGGMSTDRLTTGILVVGRTQAKNTNPLADQTSINTAASISGQGVLATRNDVGTSQINTTVITGGKIVTGLLTADNIQAGTLTGRTVQTASSGQRIILSQSDNTLRFDTAANTNVIVIDDTIEGSRPGIKITDSANGGMILITKDANDFLRLYESRLDIQVSGTTVPITINNIGTGNFVNFNKSGLKFTIDQNGVVDAAGGYKDNGSAGIDSVGAGTPSTLLVSGGIITSISKVTPAGDGTYSNPTSITISGGIITAIS